MTKEQFNEIEKRLDKWREDRGLRVEDQKLNFKKNYTEELLEFFQAELKGDEREMIDALCDMIVVTINGGGGFERGGYRSFFNTTTYTVDLLGCGLMTKSIQPLCRILRQRGYDPYKCLLETIKELESRTGSWNEQKGKWIKDVGAYTFEEAIEKSGFKYVNKVCEGVMDWYVLGGESEEVELEQKSFKKWYKADYSKCKI